MSQRLAGKRSVITGAASGIGRATAERFAEEGAKVALIDVDKEAVERLAVELAGNGHAALACVANVTDESAVAAAVATAEEAWGGLDTVIANAAIQLFGRDNRAHELDLAVWRKTIDVNLTGVFLTCKYGIGALLRNGEGSVITTGSPTGLIGSARGFDAYSASKAGVIGLTRVLAADYAQDGIRVNSVIPGYTETPLVKSVVDNPAERAAVLDIVPMRRPGTPEEVASMMVFLASDEASYTTGALMVGDGGVTAV